MGDVQFSVLAAREGDAAGTRYYRFDKSREADCEPRLFDRQWLVANGLVSGESSLGRGTTCTFNFDQRSLVLRHYRRGGAVRHLSADCYLWRGLEESRPRAEYTLLQIMVQQGLPCPRPYACRVERSGLTYRGALIMEEIRQSCSLAELLTQREVADAEWRAIGQCIRRFHDAAVFHSDLNANNILLDSQSRVYLIDFDKSGMRPGQGRHWKSANLKRLQRSILKCRTRADTFFFSPAQWPVLTEGYRSGGAAVADNA